MKILGKRTAMSLFIVALLCGLGLFAGAAYAETGKPNILVIWGDDIGHDNISAYRGVDTTIVYPARNDSWIVGAASRSYYGDLLAAGVRIFEYNGGLLHTKSLTLDGEVTLIGSAKMDRRSFELNYENNILFYDPAMTGVMRERQDSYIAKSSLVTKEVVEAWDWRHRLRNNAVAMMGPVL